MTSPTDVVFLSSPSTLLMKFVFPFVWGVPWSYFTARLFTDPAAHAPGGPPAWLKWVFLFFLLVGGFTFQIVCFSLKRVDLEGDTLRISNFFREIRVPIHEVESAGFDRRASLNGRALVGIAFRSDTPFGRSIEFYPRSEAAIDAFRRRLGPEIGGHVEAKDPAADAPGPGAA